MPMERSAWIPIPTMPSHIPQVAITWLLASPERARRRPWTPKIIASRLHQKPVMGKGIIPMIPRTSAAVPLPLSGCGFAPMSCGVNIGAGATGADFSHGAGEAFAGALLLHDDEAESDDDLALPPCNPLSRSEFSCSILPDTPTP